MREREIARRYLFELFCSVLIYTAILIPAIKFGRPMEPGLWRMAVLVSPMIGFGLMGWALIRQYRRLDEFLRSQILENTVIVAAVTAAWTFSYGFLETAGYPRLSMFTVWPVMGASWAVVAIVRSAVRR